jgi:hypothetical protein
MAAPVVLLFFIATRAVFKMKYVAQPSWIDDAAEESEDEAGGGGDDDSQDDNVVD